MIGDVLSLAAVARPPVSLGDVLSLAAIAPVVLLPAALSLGAAGVAPDR